MYQKLLEAKKSIQQILDKAGIQPQIGIVLGSGLGSYADQVQNSVVIPYKDIPNFHSTTVDGHKGNLVIGNIASQGKSIPVILMQGRLHYYEGHSSDEVVFPIRLLCMLGIRCLLLTNAAGGVNPSFREADLMVISDHINLSGVNPLRGKNIAELGPRFPDLSEAYSRDAQKIIKDSAIRMGIDLREGIYAHVQGPSYETPAEVRMLRALGGDAVGMSTVFEVIAANHMGVSVAAISCITNLGAGITEQKLTHAEVIENANKASSKMQKLVTESLNELSKL